MHRLTIKSVWAKCTHHLESFTSLHPSTPSPAPPITSHHPPVTHQSEPKPDPSCHTLRACSAPQSGTRTTKSSRLPFSKRAAAWSKLCCTLPQVPVIWAGQRWRGGGWWAGRAVGEGHSCKAVAVLMRGHSDCRCQTRDESHPHSDATAALNVEISSLGTLLPLPVSVPSLPFHFPSSIHPPLHPFSFPPLSHISPPSPGPSALPPHPHPCPHLHGDECVRPCAHLVPREDRCTVLSHRQASH